MPTLTASVECEKRSEHSQRAADRIITAEERKFLHLQAKTLGLNESQTEDLEAWYDKQLVDEEE